MEQLLLSGAPGLVTIDLMYKTALNKGMIKCKKMFCTVNHLIQAANNVCTYFKRFATCTLGS